MHFWNHTFHFSTRTLSDLISKTEFNLLATKTRYADDLVTVVARSYLGRLLGVKVSRKRRYGVLYKPWSGVTAFTMAVARNPRTVRQITAEIVE